MQPLHTNDALRCLLLNTSGPPNLAATSSSLVGRSHALAFKGGLFKEALFPQHQRRCTLIEWNGTHLQALGSVRVRSSPKAWEIDRIHLNDGADRMAAELLERLTQWVGQRGAERVFLRVPKESPLIESAQLVGFSTYLCEYLVQGEAGQVRSGYDVLGEPELLRLCQPHEEYDLFQLYCTSTPASVRSALGITFDQWRDAQDRAFEGTAKWVYTKDGRISGWLSLHPRRSACLVDLMVRPDEEVLLPLVQFALAHRQFQSWLLPEHQELARRLLLHKGFQEAGCYVQLVKWLAVKAKRPALATLEVSA